MPPKMDLTPTPGRTSPILTDIPAGTATPSKATTPTVTPTRAQQSPADPLMPSSRAPSRTNSLAANTQQRPRSPSLPTTPVITAKPDTTPTGTPKPVVASTSTSTEGAGGSEGETSLLAPEIEQQVVAARKQMTLTRKPSLEQVLNDPEVTEPLSTEERDIISAMDEFIETGHTPQTHGAEHPGGELAQQIRQDADRFLEHTPPAKGNSAVAGCARAGATLIGLMKRVAANEDFGFKGTVAASVANVTALNLVKVWGPTLVRQYLSYAIEAGLEGHVGTVGRSVLGAVPGVTATAIQAAGAYRDYREGNPDFVSNSSRAVMSGLALAGDAAALGSKSMAGIAALPVAFQLYCAMRDLGPGVAWKAVDKNAMPRSFGHWVMHTVQYGVNQALNNHLMSTHASPSGAGAYQAGAGLQHANNQKRAGINLFFENIDDLASPVMDMVGSWMDKNRETKPMQISLKNVGFSGTNFMNAFSLFSTRTSATSQGLTFGATASALIAKDKQALALLANDVILGLVNGPEYFHFSNTLSGQPPGTDKNAARDDIETALAQPVGRDAAIELPLNAQAQQTQPSSAA